MDKVTDAIMTGRLSLDTIPGFQCSAPTSRSRPTGRKCPPWEGPLIEPKTSANKSTQTENIYQSDQVLREIKQLSSILAHQITTMERLEGSLQSIHQQLQVVGGMAHNLTSLTTLCTEMVAKYDFLVMTTGRATATAAATEAYWKEHGKAPPGPALFEADALKARIQENPKSVPTDVREAFDRLEKTEEVTERTFGKPTISAKLLKELLYDHLPGYGTAFHQLAQVVCKVGKDNDLLDIIHAEFQASLAEGDSPQCALIQITKRIPIFGETPPPVIYIKTKQEIPKACQKSLRPLPPNPKIERGWVCHYVTADGKEMGLKI
ncbi:polymerase complex protein [Cuevavirus lloviuense]|uniref:Polymerase cofactor VP35 n=1 Tax=Cuevavirus lloviuense TaxID=3052148 RepID=G8EFI2_9MONO|nr:polymerase complex protein [Cuevavirus lloviuense]UJP71055.1 viral protein 35 [synthetic construct]AER23672.1 VP35 [Cuevavirus lloviuense]UJP71064.1 viral protein 35 [synthetic construct]UJP71073.1 viral protein 35 [synthetic construct]UJP71082.1 viral protein 35 [synthetic construct]